MTVNEDVLARAARVRVLLMDVDGVLTDGTYWNVPDGKGGLAEIKAFDSQDGLALQWLRRAGIKAGVALNPSTSLHAVENILDQVDLVLIMSVNPGFGGQSFIPFVLKKIEELARRLHNTTPRPELEVDGGIKLENCHDVAKAGATILVAGSAIFHAPDPRAAVRKMKEQVV